MIKLALSIISVFTSFNLLSVSPDDFVRRFEKFSYADGEAFCVVEHLLYNAHEYLVFNGCCIVHDPDCYKCTRTDESD